MAKIFISYRRDDSSGYAGRLFDILSARFGRDSVFMDLNAIRGGDDFAQVIEESIAHCDVLLAIVGERWLTSSLDGGGPRLQLPGDFVRLEIAKAFERGVRVIPVLVGKATMPRRSDLPENLRPLCARQAVELRDIHFREDANGLVDTLIHTVPHASPRAWNTTRNFIAAASALALLIAVVASSLLLRHRKTPAPATIQTQPSSSATVSAPQTAPTLPPPSRPAKINEKPAEQAPAARITGKWKATFSYGLPGDIYTESFNFEGKGAEVSGTASLQETDHTILSGRIDGNRISFTTKSTAIPDDKVSQEKHFYRGIVEGDTIQFSLVTGPTPESHPPVHFTATRIDSR